MLFPSLLVALAIAQQPQEKPFSFHSGERIVWIGNTLVEREQRYGYWEAALVRAHLASPMTIRNLGWSGDTVYGDARAGFDDAAKGFERLVSLTLELKPTLIFVSYGTNEAFEGKEGLPKFEKGMEKLLDALKPAGARLILFSPLPFQACSKLPDPKPMNEKLALYRDAILAIAAKRGHQFADLYAHCPVLPPEFTENGMHLNGEGYKATAADVFLASILQVPRKIDWAQVEPFRKAIVEKNQLFFYRWRPQNETYLFGFRKHEQGKNAKEVAEFDPLVGKLEEEIQKQRKMLMK
jgi:lysophospholipase L1-like esterase